MRGVSLGVEPAVSRRLVTCGPSARPNKFDLLFGPMSLPHQRTIAQFDPDPPPPTRGGEGLHHQNGRPYQHGPRRGRVGGHYSHGISYFRGLFRIWEVSAEDVQSKGRQQTDPLSMLSREPQSKSGKDEHVGRISGCLILCIGFG